MKEVCKVGRTFAEKILSKACGKEVRAGEVAVVQPNFCMSHENASAIIKTFEKIGLEKVFNPDAIVIIFDHTVPASTPAYAAAHKIVREFVTRQGIKNFYDLNSNGGICHQIMCQEGYAAPGMVTVGSDSHTCMHGAVGAFSTGIGRTEMAAVWATGSIWLQVPHSIKINATGAFAKGVTAKDLILKVIGDIKSDGADYMSVEFHGGGVDNMSVSERMTLCNMGVEMGAKNAVCPPDAKVLEYQRGKVKNPASVPVWADADATYGRELSYDLATLEPCVAKPHTVDNYAPVSGLGKVPIHQAFIGTCTNARLDDLRVAASVLKGRTVAVRTLVYPASRQVFREAMDEGIIQTLLDAGCTIEHPGCGPCIGVYGGALADNETCISTANRNFRGRMGSKESNIYLASPATVAWSAVRGEVSDPREVLS